MIVPHQDDEINVARTFIYDMVKKNIEVYIIYTKNGDHYPW